MRIITANIRDNPDMPRPDVRADARKLRGASVVLAQEIGEQEDHADMLTALGKGWDDLHPDRAIPIFVKRRWWRVVETGYLKTHGGMARVSPDRGVSWAVLQHRWRRGIRLAVVNTHFVSGAWSSPAKEQQAWRQDRWNEHELQLLKVIAHLHADDLTVIYGGDFNRRTVEPPAGRWINRGGIDKLGVVEGSVDVRATDVDIISLHSDHNAKRARVVLRKKR